MATVYNHQSWSHTVGTWWYETYESNINPSTNTSTITVNFYLKANHGNQRSDTYNLTNNTWAKIWINGTEVSNRSPAKFDIRYNSSKKIANGTVYNLGSGSATVYHDSNGGGSYTVTCQHYCGLTTPSYVTLDNNTHGLTKINLVSGSSWSMPGGTYAVGSAYTLNFAPCNNNISHHVYVKTAYTDWICVAWDARGRANNWNPISFGIPEQFNSGLGEQESTIMTIRAQSYNGGTYLNHQDKNVYVKNNSYRQRVDDLYFIEDLYVGDSMLFHWEADTTFGIASLYYSSTGAHVASDYLTNNLGTGGNMPAGVMTKPGDVALTVTITDYAGYQATKTIYGTIKERHRLAITGIQSLNTKLHTKMNDVNSGETYVHAKVSWEGTHSITKIVWEVSGANNLSETIWYPGGNSYTWKSGHVYNAGSNTVKCTVYDSYGDSKSTQYNITSKVEEWSISCGGSYVDKSLCVNLVKDKFYQDWSRVGVRVRVNHTHDLKYIDLVVDGVKYSIPNINPAAYEFTFICDKKLTSLGNVTVKFIVGDVNGRTASSEEIIYANKLIVDPPPKPVIDYEENVSLLLSEGEKIVFTGSSKNIEDYQVIYALSKCDVASATSPCDSIDNSYYGVDIGSLNTRLRNYSTGPMRYFILKDYGVSDSSVTQDPNAQNKFHIHPIQPNHESRYYAMQFMQYVEPGDSIYVYVIERLEGTFEMLYSDKTPYYQIPKPNMFNMCVMPLGPQPLSIYRKEQTDDKMFIEYKNPIYNVAMGSRNPIHLIDVCLIAKDAAGNIMNKSETKKRDGLNGKTWLYYSDRKWHNVFTREYAKDHGYYAPERYTMEFDISKYPKGVNLAIVAFYYTDYFNHPSIYSTSNIIVTGKQTVNMSLAFNKPLNDEKCHTFNPEIIAMVRNNGNINDQSDDYNIYQSNYNLATKFTSGIWNDNPVWIRSPIDRDSQVPNFRTNDTNEYYFKVKGFEPKNLSRALYKTEYYNLHSFIYNDASIYKIAGLNINTTGVYVENCLFLRLEDNTVELGDIHTDDLLESPTGYLTYSWRQQGGRFLSMGKNVLELYTCPYKYGQRYIQYNEINGEWFSEETFISFPIMPYNYYMGQIVRPSYDSNWDRVSGDVLDIEIPYRLLKPNKSYNLRYKILVDKGFELADDAAGFEDETVYKVTYDQEKNDLICNTYVYSRVINHPDIRISGDNDLYTDLIYRPEYTIVDKGEVVPLVNKYNQWIEKTITFNVPDQATLDKYMESEEELVIRLSTRGAYRLKVNNITLKSIDESHVIEAGRLELDTMKQEHYTSIVVDYSSYNFQFNYVNPIRYNEIVLLREYLLYLSDLYELNLTPEWRPLIYRQSYLMARDYNDIKDFSIKLFTELRKKNPDTFTGDIQALESLPYIEPGTKRTLKDPNNKKSCEILFPEWIALIDALRKQSKQ